MTAQADLALAARELNAGRPLGCKSICEKVLRVDPNNPDALNLLGLSYFNLGELNNALRLVELAIETNSSSAGYRSNHGMILRSLGRLEEAASAFREAVALAPENADFQYNLGVILLEAGAGGDAIGPLRRATSMKPRSADAYAKLGLAFQRQGDVAQAVRQYETVIEIQPDHLEATNNMGRLLGEAGNLSEAEACFRRGVAFHPSSAELHNNLGSVLQWQGKLGDAAAEYSRAIALRGDLAEAHNNLGSLLRLTEQVDKSIESFKTALSIRPDYSDAWMNLGISYREIADCDSAMMCLNKAITLAPLNRLASDALLYTLYFHPQLTGEAILAAHEKLRSSQPPAALPNHSVRSNKRDPSRRLRVGYVSPDFRDHSSILFIKPLLAHHNRDAVEVFCYSNVASEDAMTAVARRLSDNWRNIRGLNDDQAAEVIKQDKIDVLVDLTIHMPDNRLGVFAGKPAPVQVTWLGYPGTTGLPEMDYRITDRYIDPPERQEKHYTEKPVYLPHSFWSYDPSTSGGEFPIEAGSPPALDGARVAFGCLNSFAKVNAQVLDVWRRLLDDVPNSRILLLSPKGQHREAVSRQLSGRVEFVDRCPRPDYMDLYNRIDIALDTFPVNGHTTTLDALWMGVPVVTLIGDKAIGRGSWSILANLQMQELAAETVRQYIEIARTLAKDFPRLKSLRHSIRGRMLRSPLINNGQFAREMEDVFREMWRRWLLESESDVSSHDPE